MKTQSTKKDDGACNFASLIMANKCNIRTHHDWPSQVHENSLTISQNKSESECFGGAE